MASSIVKFTGREVVQIIANAAAAHLGLISGGPFEARMETEFSPKGGIASIKLELIAQKEGE
jgi:hypothetical protein